MQIASGKYNDASAVVIAALNLLALEDSKKKQLLEALEPGEKGGFVKNFNSKAHLKKFRINL